MTRPSVLTCSLLVAIFAMPTLLAGHAEAATKETTLHNFQPYLHGLNPSQIVPDGAGNLYAVSGGGTYNEGMVFKLTPKAQGGWNQTVLYNFTGGNDGATPVTFYLDPSGSIFGFTRFGGVQNFGTFFQLTPTSHGPWKESTLYTVPDRNTGNFNVGLARDAAGNFYGTTLNWFAPAYGSLFQMSRTAGGVWTENILHVFSNGPDGGSPFCTLIFDAAGNLYGTTAGGGSAGRGVVFEFSPSASGAWTETVLYNFADVTDGYEAGSLVFDGAGNLYGSTWYGGAANCGMSSGCGTVFELEPQAGGQWAKTTLFTFGNDGLDIDGPSIYPSNVVIDSAGNLYGFTQEGGGGVCIQGCGIAYKLSPSSTGQWTSTLLHGFQGGSDGYAPQGIVLGANSQIYGFTFSSNAALAGQIFKITSSGQQSKLVNLYSFTHTDAATPLANLVADSAGNFYGTTDIGGLDYDGAVYKLTRNETGGWSESLIYSFSNLFPNQVNGAHPSGLIFDSAGNLYGAAGYAGPQQFGSVYELSPLPGGGWAEKDLVDFTTSADYPIGGVVFDHAGNLYGTTVQGGANGLGAIFQLSPGTNGTWSEKLIYNFAGYPNDPANPQAGMIVDASGNLYGTTRSGGNSANCVNGARHPIGCGTVFELSPRAGGSWTLRVLYSFQGSTIDGAAPIAPVIFDDSGNLYGTTSAGGIEAKCVQSSGPPTCGTVFELLPNGNAWTEKILHEFTNSSGDGGIPVSAVVFDAVGNLYGTTSAGGAAGVGTVFKLAPGSGDTWSESVVYSFGSSRVDGKFPQSSLIFDAAGNLYGTTASGGQTQAGSSGWGGGGYGMVFEITP